MNSEAVRPAPLVALLAGVTLFAVEALRASGPPLDHVAGAGGVPAAAVTAVIVYALPLLVAPLVAALDARRGTAGAVALLVLLRLVEQALPTPGFGGALATTVVALGALVLVSHQVGRTGGARFAVGVALGGAADVAVRAAFGTWDPVWRPGLLPWLWTLVACAGLLVLLARTWRGFVAVPAEHGVARYAVLGGHLGLYLLVFGSPAFVASQGGLGAPWAAVVLLLGALLSVEALVRAGRLPAWHIHVAAALAAVATAVALFASGVLTVVAVLVGQVAAVLLLARVPRPETDPAESAPPAASGRRPSPVPRSSVRVGAVASGPASRAPVAWSAGTLRGYGLAGLGAGLGFVVIVLPYQATYDLPLPFDNRVLPIVAAVLLALPALRSAVPATVGGLRRLAAVPAVLLVVPVLVLVTTPAPARPYATGGDTLRLVTWNLHYAVNDDAAVDPAAIARVLSAQHADVIMLQEVNRGWPIGGGTDVAEWLSRELAMPYVWSPAADGQFGNVILSTLPLSDVDTGRLPYGDGPQRRSYAAATVELRSGRTLRVLTAHLQNQTDNHATRIAEIDALLGHWRRTTPAVIAGDFNSMPGWPEITRFTDAGLVSAQDTTGHAGMLSSPTDRPKYRPDWVFGTDDVSFTDFAMPRTTASDHYPLAATVSLG
ncbi:MAG TPA: endonuclease/exonuclease/phosphatase family protein [Actinocatenispora sp.]